MATHSSILAWRIPWAEEPDGTVHGVTKNGTALSEHTHTHQFTGVRYERLQGCNEKGCKWKVCIGCDVLMSHVLLSEEWWGQDHPSGMWSCSPAWLSLSSVIKGFYEGIINYPASLVAQMVKSLLAMRETWVRSQHWEDPLEKGMATHFSIPAWRIPWTEEPGRLQSVGSQRVGHDWAINTHTHNQLSHGSIINF